MVDLVKGVRSLDRRLEKGNQGRRPVGSGLQVEEGDPDGRLVVSQVWVKLEVFWSCPGNPQLELVVGCRAVGVEYVQGFVLYHPEM